MNKYHSTYKGCDIYRNLEIGYKLPWTAYYEDGMYTYSLVPLCADTLAGVKQLITQHIASVFVEVKHD